jgi:DNA-binding response OmpR family regulator
VREVRAIYSSLPIVIASGQSRKELRQLFKDMALLTFVSKPYTAEELKAAVRAIGIRC